MVDLSQFKDLYISEAEDHFQKLNDNLLLLEKNLEDDKLLDELMRSAHTVKSSSATMGFAKMAFLTHIMEDVFDFARNKYIKLTPQIVEGLFEGVDGLEKSLKSIREDKGEINLDDICQKVKTLTGVATNGTGPSPRTPDGKPILAQPVANQVPVPAPVSAVPVEEKKDESQNKQDEAEDTNLQIEQVEEISSIKVSLERLDALMESVEELLVAKMRMNSIAKFAMEHVAVGDKDPQALKFKSVADTFDRLISGIQYQVMETRLIPLGQIFARFPRMVRDLAYKQKKKVEFKVIGDDLELDRSIVVKIGEPLVHLLRNAVDHGIETEGTITLKAEREKDFAIVSVEDDGTGINWDNVAEAAVKKGLVDKRPENQKDMIKLLFRGRLSTNAEVTETSGRGVGLSVVKKYVEQFSGSVDVLSPVANGKGTRFSMQLPLTLAIIDALIVKSGDSLYAIPFASIDRSVVVKQENVRGMADQKVAIVNNVSIPMIFLCKTFDHKEGSDNIEYKVVLVKNGTERAGLVVDEIIDQQEIIIKPLSSVISDTKGFAGSTILGDGKTILILDIAGLIENEKVTEVGLGILKEGPA